MTEGVVADFRARVWDSYSGTELRPGRVVMSQKRIVLATEDGRTTIPISTIFDVAPGQAPAHLDVDSADTLTVGCFLEETRHTATFQADEEVIDRLATSLFKLTLDGVDVILRHPARIDGVAEDSPPVSATLDVTPSRIRFETGGDATTVATADITRFGRTSAGGSGEPITVRLAGKRGDVTVETDVTFDSQREANVFGRYLRANSAASGEGPTSITVLFVDDDPAFLELFATQLDAFRDVDARTAESGLAAIDHMSEHPDTDCIVSDYKMPGMDGIELLKAVREVRPNLPFILLTGMGSETVAEEALAEGVTDYLRKDTIGSDATMLGERIKRAVLDHRPHTS